MNGENFLGRKIREVEVEEFRNNNFLKVLP